MADAIGGLDRFAIMVGVERRAESLETWTDLQPGQRVVYNLVRLTNDAEIVRLGCQVFDAIQGNITLRAVCQLMLLAYNIKDSSGIYCFGDIHPDLILETSDFVDIPNTIFTTVRPINKITFTIRDNSKLAKGFCYLAASYMRLYTKSADNYIRIENHLRNGFTNFYHFPMPFHHYHPTMEALNCIKSRIDHTPTLRNTFYNLVYAGESVAAGKQLKEFLYGIHISYTGIHSYTLFLKCMEALELTNSQLVTVLYCNCFVSQLNALTTIFNTLFGTSERPGMERQMWRFARVFNNQFFSQLQTKNCALFTAVLAHLYHLVIPPQGSQDARNIACIKQLSGNPLMMAQNYARKVRNIVSELKVKEASDSKSFTPNYLKS